MKKKMKKMRENEKKDRKKILGKKKAAGKKTWVINYISELVIDFNNRLSVINFF